MHSFLITLGSSSQRIVKASTLALELLETKREQLDNCPDFISITRDKRSIGIGEIRKGLERLSLKPFVSKAKVALIEEAQNLTLEAQNALLKTLEEPPKDSFLILTCPNEDLLLPTVVSRCVNLRVSSKLGSEVPDEREKIFETNFFDLLSFSLKERLDFIELSKEDFEDRETAIKMIDTWLLALHKSLKKVALGKGDKSITGI